MKLAGKRALGRNPEIRVANFPPAFILFELGVLCNPLGLLHAVA